MHHDTAHSVKIDTDEGRLTIVIEGDALDCTFDIHGIDLDVFYNSVRSGVGGYLRERDEALASWKSARAFRCDPDESSGYDAHDPKHESFHSVHADLWDMREGK